MTNGCEAGFPDYAPKEGASSVEPSFEASLERGERRIRTYKGLRPPVFKTGALAVLPALHCTARVRPASQPAVGSKRTGFMSKGTKPEVLFQGVAGPGSVPVCSW